MHVAGEQLLSLVGLQPPVVHEPVQPECEQVTFKSTVAPVINDNWKS